jgi:two-component system alkaline phosphatase synthesis response regulator PhoP
LQTRTNDGERGAAGKETGMRERVLNAIRSKIVIVEDDELMTAVYKRLFLREEDRFICTLERNAEGALETMRRERADILILDWDLPGISGLQMLDALRANRATKLLPVIVVSGRASIEDRIQALQHGANDYLSKPFDVHELLARLQVLLRQSEFHKNRLPTGA